jgi:hypothetical protein
LNIIVRERKSPVRHYLTKPVEHDHILAPVAGVETFD